MQIVVAKSASDPRWLSRNRLSYNGRMRKAFNPNEPRDDHGRWTSGSTIGELQSHIAATQPTLTHDTSERNGVLTVSRVVVPPDERGKGAGAKFMREVTQYADAKGLTVALTPSSDFGGNKARLTRWYQSLGFVPNKGRNIDFAISESMIRRRKIGKSLYAGTSIAKMSAADAAELDRLLRQADQISAKVRQAFLDAVNNLGDRIDVEQIKSLLEDGRVDQAIRTVDAQLTAQGFTPVAQAITGAAIDAARQTANAVNSLSEMNLSFGPTNPQTVSFLRNYEMGLIRSLSQDALASVRTAIEAGVTAGRNPIDIARDVRAFIGLTERQTQAVQNYRNALTIGSRDALQRQLRDRRFDPSVARAVRGERALSNEQIGNMVSRYAARTLKSRAETIARTEAIRALNAGNHQLWNQAALSGQVSANLVTRKWITAGDHKVRASHVAIPEMNQGGVGLNVPFASPEGPILYPGDPNAPPSLTINCRCAVIYRFKAA